jgi:hypothetical protein
VICALRCVEVVKVMAARSKSFGNMSWLLKVK